MKVNSFLLALVATFFIMGCSQEKQYSVYLCPNKTESISCSDQCKKDETMRFTFLINKEKSSVMEVTYVDGVQKESTTSKNCSIFNEKNWDCLTVDEFSSKLERASKMTNGIYSYSSILSLNGKEIHSTYACGK